VVPGEGHLKVTVFLDAKTVAKIKMRISLEALAKGARGEGLIGGGGEKFEPKLFHSLVHLEVRREEDLGWSDDKPFNQE
jgi:hypothetical protein